MFLSLFARITVAFLNPADQFLDAAIDAVQIIIGELAPNLFDSATCLFPLAARTSEFNVTFMSLLLSPNYRG